MLGAELAERSFLGGALIAMTARPSEQEISADVKSQSGRSRTIKHDGDMTVERESESQRQSGRGCPRI